MPNPIRDGVASIASPRRPVLESQAARLTVIPSNAPLADRHQAHRQSFALCHTLTIHSAISVSDPVSSLNSLSRS